VTGSGFKDLAAMERMTADADCETITWQQLPECFAPEGR
jgi:hypothetical protein